MNEKLPSERLVEIYKEKTELQNRLKELEREEYIYGHQHEIDLATSYLGKYYHYKFCGTGQNQIFAPVTYDKAKEPDCIYLHGELVTLTSFLIGDIVLTASNAARVEVATFSTKWEEITKDEYLRLKKMMIRSFTKDLKDES